MKNYKIAATALALLFVGCTLFAAEPGRAPLLFGLQDCSTGLCQTSYQTVATGRRIFDLEVAAPVQYVSAPVQQQYQMQRVIVGYETTVEMVPVEKKTPVYETQCVPCQTAVSQCSQPMKQRMIVRTRKKIFGPNGSWRIRRATRKAARQSNGC